MNLTVNNFCGLMMRSRLHTQEAVKGILQRWEAVAADSANLKVFINWLISRDYLTRYQAELLAEKRADNFFLDQFKILDRVGKGRMAGVYKAAHPQHGVVALKVLPPSKARDPETLARFHREARLAIPLNHHNVVRTFAYGETRGLHYLAMEYLEGETLEDVLRTRGRLTPREAARVALLVSLGLQHLCARGMVHRDLKPANLMLTPAPLSHENTLRSLVKILDIGLGRQLFDPDSKAADLTSDGAILGTPDYLAPEQARDPRRADIRADLYSLGCLLYEMLAGKSPFADDNLVRQILRHATQEPQPLRELNPRVPEPLVRIVHILLAKNPDQRYQTPTTTCDALKAALTLLPR